MLYRSGLCKPHSPYFVQVGLFKPHSPYCCIDLDCVTSQSICCTASMAPPMVARLSLNEHKLLSLAEGLKQIAASSSDTVGRVISRTLVRREWCCGRLRFPIGVLIVIFDPSDCLLSSANGILLKGGKEATESNKVLHSLVEEALDLHGAKDAMQLINTREQIGDLLQLEGLIDLVILEDQRNGLSDQEGEQSHPGPRPC
ncbi:putative delta-1-pyrroline-5-carboxylate synthase [Apostichopus japonicus]|uniref:Putative delta-1-pyrroline-5-carboxylate synthase n=1 Tax=Stichopus japonicus TaxID=307972 RepID=A0A2G8JDM3_STIJA|nr:putative delta-1-pyrroline-5-carboxylate synthase [Apostichopus japonicus]